MCPGPNAALDFVNGSSDSDETFRMRGMNHGIDFKHNVNTNKSAAQVRCKTFLMPPQGASKSMICDEKLKAVLLGLILSNDS